MVKKSKKNFKIAAILLCVFAVGLLALQWRSYYLIKNYLLANTPENMQLSYTDLDTNILFGNIGLNNVVLKVQDKNSNQIHTSLKVKKFQIRGLGYWQLLFHKAIHIEDILISNPDLDYYPYKKDSIKTIPNKKNKSEIKAVLVAKIKVQNGKLQILQKEIDSIQLQIANYNFTLFEAKTNLETPIQKIPFSYTDYTFEANSIFANLNAYETATIGKVSVLDTNLEMLDI